MIFAGILLLASLLIAASQWPAIACRFAPGWVERTNERRTNVAIADAYAYLLANPGTSVTVLTAEVMRHLPKLISDDKPFYPYPENDDQSDEMVYHRQASERELGEQIVQAACDRYAGSTAA